METENVSVSDGKVLIHKVKKYTPIPLKNALQVSMFLEKLVNQTLKGEVEIEMATKLTYISGILLKSLEQAREEKRENEINSLSIF